MPTDLHECRLCGSPYVQPLDWERLGPRRDRVRLVLRCPECEATVTGVHSSETIDRYEQELDRGTDLVIASLARLKLQGVTPAAVTDMKENRR